MLNVTDSQERLDEMAQEEQDAQLLKLSIENLRRQRREYGLLLTGKYAGCLPSFAATMETIKDLNNSLVDS